MCIKSLLKILTKAIEKNLRRSYIFKSAKDVACRQKILLYYSFIKVIRIIIAILIFFWNCDLEIFREFPGKPKQIKCDLKSCHVVLCRLDDHKDVFLEISQIPSEHLFNSLPLAHCNCTPWFFWGRQFLNFLRFWEWNVLNRFFFLDNSPKYLANNF